MLRLLICVEHRENRVSPAVLRLISAASSLGESATFCLCALGSRIEGLAQKVCRYRAEKIYLVDHGNLEHHDPRVMVRAIDAVVCEDKPDVVLFPASADGRDLAARLAMRKGAALVSNATAWRVENHSLVVTKSVYSGRLTAEIRLPKEGLKIVSLRSGVYPPASLQSFESPIIHVACDIPETSDDWEYVGFASPSDRLQDVTEAEIIVSGGAGLKTKENFQMLHDLANRLGAAVGASRGACDAGFQPYSHQIGLTGKTVAPKLYLALGIDGAVQHLAGMRHSKVIVAVNTKREAPIFQVAQYGCVCDALEFVPALIEEMQRVRCQSPS